MRLEILVDSEEPAIYPLNKPEIVIGSGDSCDIVLGSSGVSRKHLKVIVEGDSFYVLDQGSTNGTFINEERLVPGRKTEFTSFFPVRLGGRVLLSLLSDEDAQDSTLSEFTAPKKVSSAAAPSDSTRVLSLKDIQESSTKKLVKKRQEIVARKKTTKPPPKKASPAIDLSMLKSILVAVFILGGAIYYNFYIKKPNVVAPTVPVVKPVTEEDLLKSASKKSDPTVEKTAPVEGSAQFVTPVIVDDDLIPVSRINSLFSDLKCLIAEEIYFCDLLPTLQKGNGGVAAVADSFVFLVEQTPWVNKGKFDKANGVFAKTEAQGHASIDDDVYKLAFFYYLNEALKPIDMTKYSGKKIYIAFYEENEKQPKVSKIFVFKVEILPTIIKLMEGNFFQNYRTDGALVFDRMNNLYRVY